MRNRNRFLAAILSTIFCSLLVAESARAAVSLALMEESGGTKARVSYAMAHKWDWKVNSEGVRTVGSKVVIAFPADFAPKAAKGSSETTKFKAAGDKLVIRFEGLKERFAVVSTTGVKKTFEIALAGANATVIDENCAKQLVGMKAKNPAFPFYIGISCQTKGETLLFSIAFPKEAELTKSSIFESKGKGESYRLFETGNIKAASGDIAQFTLDSAGKKYDFSVVSLRKESGKDERPNAGRIGLGLDYNMLSVQSGSVSVADSKPGLVLKIPPFPVFWGIDLGFKLETALSMSSTNPNSISYTQAEFFANYDVVSNSKFTLAPRLYYVISDHQHSGSKAGLKHSSLGAGLFTSFSATDRLVIGFEAFNAAFGSAVVKSHLSLDLSLLYRRLTEQGMSYGGGAKMQNYAATSVSGGDSKFNQTIVYGLVLF